MPYNLSWDSPDNTRLLLEFTDPITWEEFHEGVKAAHMKCAVVSQQLDLVIWPRAPLPNGLALSHFSLATQGQPENIEQLVVVTGKNSSLLTFARHLAGVIRRLYPLKSRITFVETIEQARQTRASLKESDPLE